MRTELSSRYLMVTPQGGIARVHAFTVSSESDVAGLGQVGGWVGVENSGHGLGSNASSSQRSQGGCLRSSGTENSVEGPGRVLHFSHFSRGSAFELMGRTPVGACHSQLLSEWRRKKSTICFGRGPVVPSSVRTREWLLSRASPQTGLLRRGVSQVEWVRRLRR